MRPDVDYLVVTLTVGDDASAVLLLDLPDLFVGVFQLCLFLFRNDHVRNANRDTGFSCFGEAEFLEFVECRDGLRRAGDLVTTPDNIAELLFAGRFVEESELPRPNLIENHATRRGLNYFVL